MTRDQGHVVIALYPSSQQAHRDLLTAPMSIYVSMRETEAGNACLIASGEAGTATALGDWAARLTSPEVWLA